MENNIDKDTCWYQQEVVNEMNLFFDLHRGNPETSWHFEYFKKLLEHAYPAGSPGVSLLDLGCGNGQLQDFCDSRFTYYASDLQHVVEGCLYRNYPHMKHNLRAIQADIINNNLQWISQFDIVVLNGIIDIMQYPVEIMDKVLNQAGGYVIIHRQEITESGTTQSIKKPSYNSQTYHSIINRNDFNNLVSAKGFRIEKEEKLRFSNWENGGSSFLLKKQ